MQKKILTKANFQNRLKKIWTKKLSSKVNIVEKNYWWKWYTSPSIIRSCKAAAPIKLLKIDASPKNRAYMYPSYFGFSKKFQGTTSPANQSINIPRKNGTSNLTIATRSWTIINFGNFRRFAFLDGTSLRVEMDQI